ncbi:MAG: DUF3857 domain-containing protein [Acidobacteria bacterium]|nr:DUF3857 domain-containing protein [Acidobacteriota bacterium]MCB9398198.1 DUF3857 domain-containing protein [Acidobacteriota bacterium]
MNTLFWLFLAFYAPQSSLNYADTELDQLIAKVEQASQDPVDAVLLADSLYLKGHTSARQGDIAKAVLQLFETVQDGEAASEIGYILTQIYRQSGDFQAIEKLVPTLGYVPHWLVLGPLPNRLESPLNYLKSQSFDNNGRTVSWLPLDSFGPHYWDLGVGQFGFFDVNAAIFPTQLTSAVLTTQFDAGPGGIFNLAVGFDYRVRVFVDGSMILDIQADHAPHPDQHRVQFQVKKGWHQLTLVMETDSENSNLGFFTRLTGQNGIVPPFQAVLPTRKLKDKTKVLSAQPDLLAQAAAKGPYALGTVLLLKEWGTHPQYGSAFDQLVKHFELEPDENTLEKMLSLSEDDNQKIKFLNTFLKKFPEDAFALTQLGQIALEQERFWEARRYGERALESQVNYWPARILINNTLARLGLTGLAMRETEALNQQYPGVPWIVMDLCDLAWHMDFQNQASPLIDQIIAMRHNNNKFLERKIALLKKQANVSGLDRIFQQALQVSPYSLSILGEYAQFLVSNNRFEDAESLLAKALKQTPENPFVLQFMGEMKLRTGQSDGMDYLRQALAIRPQNPDLENLLTLSQDDVVEFYAPYYVEPSDVDRFPVGEVTSVVVNLDQAVVKVNPNGQSSEFHQMEWEVIGPNASRELPGYSFSYAPLRQKAELLKAEIYRGDQTLILNQKGQARISDPEYRTYYDLVAYQVAFPNLKVGDRIRVEYRIDETQSSNIYGDYFGDLVYFTGEYPIRTQRYTLIFPKGRQLYYHHERMNPKFTKQEVGDQVVYQWTLKDISSAEREARMPGPLGYLPYVSVSTFKDWSQMGRWYSDLVGKQLELDHTTKQRVAELIQGVNDPLEKVKRIHEFVITHTRYVALEFGIHGYKPYQVNQVCNRQFGDCKDKASLMVAMLREAGVEASIAIVRTKDKGEIHTEPASLAYFNHAIAYVPAFDLFLDGTAEFSGMDELPEMDQGALTLLVHRNGTSELRHIPYLNNNSQELDLKVALDSNGNAQFKGKLALVGARVPALRQALSLEGKIDKITQNILVGSIPGILIQKAERKGTQINEPISLAFEGTSSQFLLPNGNGFKLPLRFLSDALTPDYAPNASRQFPIETGPPHRKVIKLSLTLPKNFKFGKLPETLALEDEFLKIAVVTETRDERTLSITYEIAFKTPLIPVSAYENLRKFLLAHDASLEQTLDLTKPQS